VAQEHVTTTLANAVLAERVAQCYLFCGPRGVGKTTTARILAKVLNCADRSGVDPCDACASCRSIAAGTSMNVLEIDGASNNSVEDVRELREVVRYLPTEGKRKIYIIDEIHMLSAGAFNALLKTLEEPPEHVVFIFATTEVQKVPDTILSRCQRFNFRRIPIDRIAEHLRLIAETEEIRVDEEALFLLASRADGALRDAESLMDQVVSFDPSKVSVESVRRVLGLADRGMFFELSDAVAKGEPQRVLTLLGRAVDSGVDIEEFLYGFVAHVRNLMYTSVQGSAALLEASQTERGRYEQAAGAFTSADLVRILRDLLELQGALRRSVQPRFRVEMALVHLAVMGRAAPLGELLARIRRLEEDLRRGRMPGSGIRKAAAEREAVTAPSVDASEPGRPESSGESSARGAPRIDEERALPAGATGSSAQEEETRKAPLSRDTVRRGWSGLVADVRTVQPALAMFLHDAEPADLRGSVLRVVFPGGDRFQLTQVEKNREVIEELMEKRWGVRLRLDCTMTVESGGDVPEKRAAQMDPAVRAVLDVLDGELT